MNNNSILISFSTFYIKEVKRFLKVWGQTILGPIINTSLFLLVFGVSMSSSHINTSYTYIQFLVPGLLMMTIIQNAFANTSSSLLIAKMNGNIVDILMAPLTPFLIILGYILGGITRVFVLSICVIAYVSVFTNLAFHNIFIILYYGISASIMLGLMGLMIGQISVKFDQVANFTNLIVTPLSFLSGTFYSIAKLPLFFQTISHYNPFFYLIDGFRYGFIGVSDFSIYTGSLNVLIINIILFITSTYLWKSGYKIKA